MFYYTTITLETPTHFDLDVWKKEKRQELQKRVSISAGGPCTRTLLPLSSEAGATWEGAPKLALHPKTRPPLPFFLFPHIDRVLFLNRFCIVRSPHFCISALAFTIVQSTMRRTTSEEVADSRPKRVTARPRYTEVPEDDVSADTTQESSLQPAKKRVRMAKSRKNETSTDEVSLLPQPPLNSSRVNANGSGSKRVVSADTEVCLLYTSPSPRDRQKSRMPSSA